MASSASSTRINLESTSQYMMPADISLMQHPAHDPGHALCVVLYGSTPSRVSCGLCVWYNLLYLVHPWAWWSSLRI